MATRPASKLNLQEFGIQDEIELVDKQARQSIENIIDDTATSDDSTYSSSKIETELSSIEDEIDAIIDDTTTAYTSTWSSEKINDEFEDSSVTKEASGNPIELTDAASAPLVRCETEIQGSQDLHGYDKPWVGGAGKNKLPLVLADIKANNTSGTWNGNSYTYNGVTFTVQTDADNNVIGVTTSNTATTDSYMMLYDSSFPSGSYVVNGCPVGGAGDQYFINVTSGVNYRDYGRGANVSITNSASVWVQIKSGYGDGLTFYPMIRLATETDPTFEPYSNICPITAYTEGEIEVRGKNILSYDNVGINWDGTNIPKRIWASFEVSPGKYTFHTKTNSLIAEGKVGYGKYPVPMTQAQWDESGSRYITDIGSGGNTTVTTNETYKYLLIGFISNSASITEAELEAIELQCEKGESFTSYEKPNHTTHTTTYPSAIYQGSEDCVNGSVECDKPKVVFNGSENWLANATYTTQFGLDVTSFNVKHNGAYAIGCLSNLYQCVAMDAANRPNGSFSIYEGTWGGVSYGRVLVVRDDRFTSVSDFKTALSSVPMELVYELISPTTSSATTTNLPIKSLLGYTHIESSTGDMEVEYITSEYQPLVDLIEDEVELPAVTSLDDGKVLTVVDGKWVAASLPVGQNIQY